ncbi:MAG: tetratricopeptide repeat protein [Streptomyces sp.]|nr:tetratricopeptide repeat protein [Streptomyces sp.]
MTVTSERATTARNAFQQTMVGLECVTDATGQRPDIFSQASVEAFEHTDWKRFGYRFTQVFEPSVLQEVAVLEGVPHDDLVWLRHRPTAAARRLGGLVDGHAELGFVEQVNLASVLINLARHDLAETVLTRAAARADGSRERFEVAWLEFMISNRREDGRTSGPAFAAMRQAITEGGVPPHRTLDACTQAVVWYLKRQEVPAEDFHWSVRVGNAIATRQAGLDSSGLSSWYRGLAMLPAAKGLPQQTRAYMEAARSAAEETVRQQASRAYELNLLKTYHESALKEHMYVTKDRDRAIEAGRALIDLDPAWSVSYGELAEGYRRFGSPREAAELYDTAARTGPPYVGHHLMMAASCWEQVGEPEAALADYLTLTELVPGNADVLSRGARCARRLSHPASATLHAALERLTGRSDGR